MTDWMSLTPPQTHTLTPQVRGQAATKLQGVRSGVNVRHLRIRSSNNM